MILVLFFLVFTSGFINYEKVKEIEFTNYTSFNVKSGFINYEKVKEMKFTNNTYSKLHTTYIGKLNRVDFSCFFHPVASLLMC